jgi:3-hydroxybutyrate dehydrogenase
MSKLSGKTALITGSTSGIGQGIAEQLAKEGANIVLNGLGDFDLIEMQRVNLVEKYGVEVRYQPANLSEVSQIETMMANTLAEFGTIDILINNAGIQFVAPIENFPVDKFNAILAINMIASWHTTRLAIPKMKEQRWGRIVNIASAHALIASPFKSAYVMAKHGIAGLTKSVALETAEFGITMNAICPGYVWTTLVEQQIPSTAHIRGITEEQVITDVLLASQPTKKFVMIEEVAALTSFLVSDLAKNITGSMQSIDGGWTAG